MEKFSISTEKRSGKNCPQNSVFVDEKCCFWRFFSDIGLLRWGEDPPFPQRNFCQLFGKPSFVKALLLGFLNPSLSGPSYFLFTINVIIIAATVIFVIITTINQTPTPPPHISNLPTFSMRINVWRRNHFQCTI